MRASQELAYYTMFVVSYIIRSEFLFNIIFLFDLSKGKPFPLKHFQDATYRL